MGVVVVEVLVSQPIDVNITHRFGDVLPDTITQDDIARCPTMQGVTTIEAVEKTPPNISLMLAKLPYRDDRKYTWLYVRPQRCEIGKPDHRSGNWFHMDVDAVGRCVAPDWNDDFQAMAVAFGDIAETEFIAERATVNVEMKPQSSDYVKYSDIDWSKHRKHSPAPRQIAHYTIRDFHRAGPIRKSGWRLIVLVFQTNTPPQDKWP